MSHLSYQIPFYLKILKLLLTRSKIYLIFWNVSSQFDMPWSIILKDFVVKLLPSENISSPQNLICTFHKQNKVSYAESLKLTDFAYFGYVVEFTCVCGPQCSNALEVEEQTKIQ